MRLRQGPAKASLIKKSPVPVSARTVVIQSTTCQLPAHPGTVREKRLKAGSAARVPRGAKPPKVTPRHTLLCMCLGEGHIASWYLISSLSTFNFTHTSHPKLAVVLLEFLTPKTILRQVIAGRTVLWEASKPPTRRMTMLRVLTRAGPTCLRHTHTRRDRRRPPGGQAPFNTAMRGSQSAYGDCITLWQQLVTRWVALEGQTSKCSHSGWRVRDRGVKRFPECLPHPAPILGTTVCLCLNVIQLTYVTPVPVQVNLSKLPTASPAL
jgi:hypothetical protein